MRAIKLRPLLTDAGLAVAGVAIGFVGAVIGTGSAAAQPAPHVVGMSETAATRTLDAAHVPYTIVNRAGSPSGTCTVTEQRDKGDRTVVEYEYDYKKSEFTRVEKTEWRGIGLVVVCR